MYDPKVGQFVSEDPSEFGGGDMNLYRYCRNGPTDGVDPSGLAEEICNRDKFRKAAKDNNVPDQIINGITNAADQTTGPWFPFGEHNACEQWVNNFEDNLSKAGIVPDPSLASGGTIASSGQTAFKIPPGAEGNGRYGQDHVVYYIGFKNGSGFFMDNGTMAKLDGKNSNFSPIRIPRGWIPPSPLPWLPPKPVKKPIQN